MAELNRDYGSPSNYLDSLRSDDYTKSSYYQRSDEKNRSANSRSEYESFKKSEREIVDHLEKAAKFQNERLTEELNTNAFYKKELEGLRSALAETRTKVTSNHFPGNDQDYLLESTKERIRNLQYQRENEVAQRTQDYSASPSQYNKIERNTDEKLRTKTSQFDNGSAEKGYNSKTEEEFVSERLMDSVGTNKTYDLSQSLRASSFEYRDKLTGGLKNLEEKMNQMEKELDDHLIHKNKEYFTNKELVKLKQRQLEEQRRRNENNDLNEQSEEEEENQMQSLQQKENHVALSNVKKEGTDLKFKNAFEKREEKLKKDNEEIEKEILRKTESSKRQGTPSLKNYQEEEELEEREKFEEEIDILKEENLRIRHELENIKKNYEKEQRHGEIKAHPADLEKEEHNLSITNGRTLVVRKPVKTQSNQAVTDFIKEEEIKETISKARKEVHDKMQKNRNQSSKVMNKNKNKALQDSHKKQEFLGVRNEIYKKYYGHPTHLKEATYFLSKGLPTSYMSDSRPYTEHPDPKKTLPKRYANALKY